jgi:hypothetical protein
MSDQILHSTAFLQNNMALHVLPAGGSVRQAKLSELSPYQALLHPVNLLEWFISDHPDLLFLLELTTSWFTGHTYEDRPAEAVNAFIDHEDRPLATRNN